MAIEMALMLETSGDLIIPVDMLVDGIPTLRLDTLWRLDAAGEQRFPMFRRAHPDPYPEKPAPRAWERAFIGLFPPDPEDGAGCSFLYFASETEFDAFFIKAAESARQGAKVTFALASSTPGNAFSASMTNTEALGERCRKPTHMEFERIPELSLRQHLSRAEAFELRAGLSIHDAAPHARNRI